MATNKKSKKNNSTTVLAWVAGVIAAALLIFLFYAGATGMFVNKTSDPKDNTLTSGTQQTQPEDIPAVEGVKTYDVIPEGHPVVTVEMENGKKFKMELYPEYAPQTVANFVALAKSGFYDGVGFHRIVEGFMAQGGDPEGTGMGGAEHNIIGEFSSNGFDKNTLSHTRGVISMARSNHPDSTSSQFFICYDDATFLDGNYAAFGKVIEGMEVVDEFLEVERTTGTDGAVSSPTKPIVMKTVTVK